MVNQYLYTFESKDSKMKRYVEKLKRESSKFVTFEIKQISKNKNGIVDALSTLSVVCEARVIFVMILVEAHLEETKKALETLVKSLAYGSRLFLAF